MIVEIEIRDEHYEATLSAIITAVRGAPLKLGDARLLNDLYFALKNEIQD